jgi:hypothetical protein
VGAELLQPPRAKIGDFDRVASPTPLREAERGAPAQGKGGKTPTGQGRPREKAHVKEEAIEVEGAMIALPTHVSTRWIATLGNDELVAVEAQLYEVLRAHERAEKSRAGSRYVLLQGPSELVNAWHQWVLVSNETRARGVVVRRRR